MAAASSSMSVFVPGRVCLFGEHSDWAGGFRRFSSDIEKGYTIVVGTNQGLHAEIRKHPHSLVVSSVLADGSKHGPVTIPMRKKDLLAAARVGDFFSYVAGVAYKMLTDYQISGIVIDNFKTTLPAEKGLSSSAAVCVLTARAFSLLYDLKLTIRGEMEYAYQGEILTPSQCGRMDQGCAYGSRPILMTYDGEHLDVEEMVVPPGTSLHYVLVDLQGDKSTTIILQGLQAGYPEPKTDVDRGVHALLGSINKDINMRACDLFSKGDAKGLGELMYEAQAAFDKHAQPACPSQLTMPLLHKVMNHEPLRSLVWGIKGVGSQGDGTGQLLCRGPAEQEEVQKILERDFKMPSITLTISSGTGIKVAVIPAAGFGAHNFPATLPVRAEMFPLVSADGVAKPIIFHNVEQLVAAGIERILIVVQSDDLHSFERLFKKPVPPADLAKLSKEQQEYAARIIKLGERVTFIVQDKQEGFGHAVWCCKDLVGNEPFMLMLGDHVYKSTMNDRLSCVAQMIETYKRYQTNVIGLKTTPITDVNRFGAISGVLHRDDPEDDGAGGFHGTGKLVDIHTVVEKPTVAYAREMLGIPNMPQSEVLTMFGLYILNPSIFQCLEERITKNVRDNGQFSFTPALDRLRKEEGVLGFVIEGQRYDIGDPDSYLETIKSLSTHAAEAASPTP